MVSNSNKIKGIGNIFILTFKCRVKFFIFLEKNFENSKCIKTLTGHTSTVCCLQLIDTNTLASGSYDNTIKIWNLNNSQYIKLLNGHTSTISCLQLIDQNTLASGS